METYAGSARQPRRQVVMAMVLGTALSTLGVSPALAVQTNATTVRAVNNISRYCTVCWRNARLPADCWNDCTQEVLTRLLERVAPTAWNEVLTAEGEERREFLRAIDAVKKRTQRGLKRSTNLVSVPADRREGRERQIADDRAAVQKAAAELLSLRQQRILQLSFEGWSVQDLATELQLPAERVSDEKYKAIRRLREHLCRSERETVV